MNQYKSIFTSAGGTFSGLASQFDGVQAFYYWSGTVYAPNPSSAWLFIAGNGFQFDDVLILPRFAVAVRPGDVAPAIPEPQTYPLMLMGVGAVLLARRRRTR